MIMRVLLVLAVLFLIPLPVVATSCEDSVAKQYVASGEYVAGYTQVKIGTTDYCIFKIGNAVYGSDVLVISNGKRTPSQICTFNNCQENPQLGQAIFSYLTAEYAESHSADIFNSLQQIYNSFIGSSHKYEPNLAIIRQGVTAVIESADIAPLKLSKFISIDVSGPLKSLVLEKVNIIFDPDWNTIIDRYNSYMNSIVQTTEWKQKYYISYDHEVTSFYEKSVAIQQFVKVVDSKTGSSLSSVLGSLDFSSVGTEFLTTFPIIISNIDTRIKNKHNEASNSDKTLSTSLNTLDRDISNSMGKGVLRVGDYKSSYCKIKSSFPSKDLIDRELFNDYINQNLGLSDMANENSRNLQNDVNTSPDKFPLFSWVDKILWDWGITKGC